MTENPPAATADADIKIGRHDCSLFIADIALLRDHSFVELLWLLERQDWTRTLHIAAPDLTVAETATLPRHIFENYVEFTFDAIAVSITYRRRGTSQVITELIGSPNARHTLDVNVYCDDDPAWTLAHLTGRNNKGATLVSLEAERTIRIP